MKIAAGKFKATCLQLMDDVNEKNMEIIITKWGKPVAKLTPIQDKTKKSESFFGFMKDDFEIKDGEDIFSTGVIWDATL